MVIFATTPYSVCPSTGRDRSLLCFTGVVPIHLPHSLEPGGASRHRGDGVVMRKSARLGINQPPCTRLCRKCPLKPQRAQMSLSMVERRSRYWDTNYRRSPFLQNYCHGFRASFESEKFSALVVVLRPCSTAAGSRILCALICIGSWIADLGRWDVRTRNVRVRSVAGSLFLTGSCSTVNSHPIKINLHVEVWNCEKEA